MIKRPCIGCKFEPLDKNNPTCRECDRRVEYVALIEEDMNIEHRTSNAQRRMKKMEIEETAGVRIEKRKYHKSTINNQQSKECLIEGCGKGIYCRGLCRNHFQQWYKGYIDHPVFGAYKVAQPKKNSLNRGEQIMDKNKTGSKGTEGTKNKLIDLNNHMFAQMERLSDEELEGDKLAEEIMRSKAISTLSIQIIDNAKLMLDAHVKIKELLIENPPKMLGAQGYEEKE